jgi:hypothetical protein
MTQNPSDQLAKQYLEEFLAPLGAVQRTFEVPGESKFVDVWFTPTLPPPAIAPDLGLLSRIATTPCLLEPFRNAPKRHEVRSCLLKLLWLQEDVRRKLDPPEADLPHLWILAADISQPVLRECVANSPTDWGPGVYFMAAILKAAIVVIDELPLTEENLWVRILGKGMTQRQAISEVLALASDDPRRDAALRLLTSWRVIVERAGAVDSEMQEVMMAYPQVFLEWERKTEARGEERGEERGIQEGKRSIVFALLEAQIGPISPTMADQIQSLSVPQLDHLAVALLHFTSAADVEEWLAQQTGSGA